MSTTYRAKEGADVLAVRHLGIITERCLRYWKCLRPETRAHFDVEDLVGEVVLKVFWRSGSFDPSRSRESTWVYCVANNACLSVLNRFAEKKRSAAEVVALDDLEDLSCRDAERERLEAFDLVEEAVRIGTDEEVDAIENLFGDARAVDSSCAMSLARLFRRVGASEADVRTALKYA